MRNYFERRSLSWLITLIVLIFVATMAHAGGPKYVAGLTYFNSSEMGQSVHWKNGQLNYFVDQGALSALVNNQQAKAMVDAAAAVWSAVPTAGITLTDQGQLNEDVNGINMNVQNGVIVAPSDLTSSAAQYPLGVIFDQDGSVINAVIGAGASDPTDCESNIVFEWLDGFNPDATFAHAVIVLNGLCATNSTQIALMTADLERAFGQVLGLDFAQVNASGSGGTGPNWAVMQPPPGVVGTGLPALTYDDIAAVNRIYPITSANLASFPGKELTASNTVSIQGTINFKAGVGMQGVNVVARPLDNNGNVLNQYGVSFVSGSYFSGNHGNPVTGMMDTDGNRLSNYGSTNIQMQGYFDLSGIPLPPGVTKANYQVSFEQVNPNYILTESVGPYVLGSPQPSGTMPTVSVPEMQAGSSQMLTETVVNSAGGGYASSMGRPFSSQMVPGSGMWVGRISQIGKTDWYLFPVLGGRTFTVVVQPLNESGAASGQKLLPVIGIWDAYDRANSTPVGRVNGPNGSSPGESWLQMRANGNDVVRIAIADQRGDGRPDYNYEGWVLYAATVTPTHLPLSGGAIVIRGMGFHAADTVLIGGQPAIVTRITPNEIDAIAPAAATNGTGSVNVEVDDQPMYIASAIISAGVSYDAGSGDALNLVTAPMNTVPVGVAQPFTVTALQANLTPANGVNVTYTVKSGTATLACGQLSCAVTATGDGRATMNVTATDGTWSIVTATLANGAILQAQFGGVAAQIVSTLTPALHLAAGTTINWPAQALVLSNGQPVPGRAIALQPGTGVMAQSPTLVTTAGNGVASVMLTVGPLAAGASSTTTACLNGTSQCANFFAYGSRPEYAYLSAVSGISQTLAVSGTPAPIVLRVLDMNGNVMAGGTVTLYQSLYASAPPCGLHSVCARPVLLAKQVTTATSALDGTVTFTPASLSGIATNLVGIAVTGNTSTLNIAIEQHR